MGHVRTMGAEGWGKHGGTKGRGHSAALLALGPWCKGELVHARDAVQACHCRCDRTSRPQIFCVSAGGTVQQCQVPMRLSMSWSTAGTSLGSFLLAKNTRELRALFC